MSRYFIKNKQAIMGLTLSQIGLIIASAILLSAVFSLVFANDWQRKAELENIATSFSTIVEAMDSRFFENTTSFSFPEKNYYYTISISTEYITISAKGNKDNTLSIKERFLVKPWPQDKSLIWVGGNDLHACLNTTFGNTGYLSDPIQDVDNVKNYLTTEFESAKNSLVLDPLNIVTTKTVYLDKTCIYYKGDEKQSFIFIYQK